MAGATAVVLLLLLLVVQVSTDIEIEGPQNQDVSLKEYKDSKDENPKVPKFIRRKYQAWLTAPRNTSKLYHGIPFEVTQLDDGQQLLTSPFRKANGTILKAHLWMEFPKITTRPRLNRYFIDVTPVIGSRDATDRNDDCSHRTFSSRPRLPGGELEMRFDMTALYKNCQRASGRSKYFKFKLRFHAMSKSSDIDLKKDQTDMFLILKEVDNDSLLLSSIIEEKHQNIMMKRYAAALSEDSDIGLKKSQDDTLLVAKEEVGNDSSAVGSRIEVRHQKITKYPQPRLFMRPPRKGYYARCSLQKWEVNFKEIGWDSWIVVPLSYEPNMCTGVCAHPFPDHMNATNYAILRSIVQAMWAKPRNPCCVAKDLAPLTVIILEEGNFMLKVIKDMKVKSCACL